MARILIALACMVSAAFAQKGGKMTFPDIVPPNFDHPDATADPHFTKQFQNDRTRVLRVHLAADEISQTYEAPDGLFVCLRECHVRLVYAGGHDQDIHLQDGETRWAYAGVQQLRNLSTRGVDMIFVEFPG